MVDVKENRTRDLNELKNYSYDYNAILSLWYFDYQ